MKLKPLFQEVNTWTNFHSNSENKLPNLANLPSDPSLLKLTDFIRDIDHFYLAKYLQAGFALRQELTNVKYHITNCSMTGLVLTICKGDNPLDQYYVKEKSKNGLHLTLRKRTKLYTTLPKLSKTNLSMDGLEFMVSKK